MASMTSRQRVLAALRREEVDYVPCCMSFNPLAETLRRGYDWNFPWAMDASVEDMLEIQVGSLGLDQIVGVPVDLIRPAEGVESRCWMEGDILHKAWTTPAGELHAAVRRTDEWPHGEEIPFYSDFNVGHYVEPWITSEADLACFREILRLDDSADTRAAASEQAEEGLRLADRFGLARLALIGKGLTGAQQLFGVTDLCMATLDNPALVHAYMDHEHTINLRHIELAAELGVDVTRRNGFYETADFYSPQMLEEFVGPRVRGEADLAQSLGMRSSYTVHTGVMPILDYLAGLTVDSFFGVDLAFKGADPARIRDALCENHSIWTGPSSTYHLWQGPEATRQAVREVFEVFGKRGLILSPCVSAHSIMPWQSTLAMIDEWKTLR
jgi:hypothetical protein